MRLLSFVAAGVALASGLVGNAQAVTQSRYIVVPAGVACQLSIPTIDTSVRPRSTGYRNEGTTAAYAICGVAAPDQQAKIGAVTFYSIDGASHTFNCTAVNDYPDSGAYAYSTKSVTAASTTSRATLQFTPADFGGAGPNLPHEGYFSATCALPPGVSVGYVYLNYDEDVGS